MTTTKMRVKPSSTSTEIQGVYIDWNLFAYAPHLKEEETSVEQKILAAIQASYEQIEFPILIYRVVGANAQDQKILIADKSGKINWLKLNVEATPNKLILISQEKACDLPDDIDPEKSPNLLRILQEYLKPFALPTETLNTNQATPSLLTLNDTSPVKPATKQEIAEIIDLDQLLEVIPLTEEYVNIVKQYQNICEQREKEVKKLTKLCDVANKCNEDFIDYIKKEIENINIYLNKLDELIYDQDKKTEILRLENALQKDFAGFYKKLKTEKESEPQKIDTNFSITTFLFHTKKLTESTQIIDILRSERYKKFAEISLAKEKGALENVQLKVKTLRSKFNDYKTFYTIIFNAKQQNFPLGMQLLQEECRSVIKTIQQDYRELALCKQNSADAYCEIAKKRYLFASKDYERYLEQTIVDLQTKYNADLLAYNSLVSIKRLPPKKQRQERLGEYAKIYDALEANKKATAQLLDNLKQQSAAVIVLLTDALAIKREEQLKNLNTLLADTLANIKNQSLLDLETKELYTNEYELILAPELQSFQAIVKQIKEFKIPDIKKDAIDFLQIKTDLALLKTAEDNLLNLDVQYDDLRNQLLKAIKNNKDFRKREIYCKKFQLQIDKLNLSAILAEDAFPEDRELQFYKKNYNEAKLRFAQFKTECLQKTNGTLDSNNDGIKKTGNAIVASITNNYNQALQRFKLLQSLARHTPATKPGNRLLPSLLFYARKLAKTSKNFLRKHGGKIAIIGGTATILVVGALLTFGFVPAGAFSISMFFGGGAILAAGVGAIINGLYPCKPAAKHVHFAEEPELTTIIPPEDERPYLSRFQNSNARIANKLEGQPVLPERKQSETADSDLLEVPPEPKPSEQQAALINDEKFVERSIATPKF